jgi:hypothetical protein
MDRSRSHLPISASDGGNRSAGNARASWSALFAILSVATMPLAVVATHASRSFRLIDAAYGIPVGLALGFAAVGAARAAARFDERSLGRLGGRRARRFGRIVGIFGICVALTALISISVYGLLQYLASRN